MIDLVFALMTLVPNGGVPCIGLSHLKREYNAMHEKSTSNGESMCFRIPVCPSFEARDVI